MEIKKFAQSATRWVGSPQSIVTHTLVFAGSFAAVWLHVLELDRMLLILTTLVSLEAIYLAIFIQMTINEQAQDIDEIQEDIEGIQEDVEEMQEDVEDIQEDVEDIQEDVEEMHEEEVEEEAREQKDARTLEEIRAGLQRMMQEIEALQKR